MPALEPNTPTVTEQPTPSPLERGATSVVKDSVGAIQWVVKPVTDAIAREWEKFTEENSTESFKIYKDGSATTVVSGETIARGDVKGSVTKGMRYAPVVIEILTGKYANLKYDLGTNANEVEVTQDAEWKDAGEMGIRSGAHFERISHREISFTVDYYLPNEDVSPLVENWAALHEITSAPTGGSTASRQPPLLIITIGKQKYGNCVLTKFNGKYDNPLPDNAGLRHAEVSVSFIAFGGIGSVYQTAPPYAPTSLQADVADETQSETEERQKQAAIEQTLADCIGDQARSVTKIINEGHSGNVPHWLSLTPEAFVQAAVAGLMDEVIDDTAIQQRLKESLARSVARKYATLPQDISILENALINGDSSPPLGGSGLLTEIIPSEGITNYEKIKADYDIIYTGIINKTLKKDVTENPNANSAQTMLFDPIKGVAVCGAKLLEQGINLTTDANTTDEATLKAINNFIANKDDTTLIEAFNIPDSGQQNILKVLKQGQPYDSKQDFYDYIDDNTLNYSGASAWSGFNSYQAEQLTVINTFIADSSTDVAAIKTRFGVTNEVAIKIKNGGNAFSSLEKFYKATGGMEQGVEALIAFTK